MWGLKSEKVWKPWVLWLKHWSLSMHVSDEEWREWELRIVNFENKFLSMHFSGDVLKFSAVCCLSFILHTWWLNICTVWDCCSNGSWIHKFSCCFNCPDITVMIDWAKFLSSSCFNGTTAMTTCMFGLLWTCIKFILDQNWGQKCFTCPSLESHLEVNMQAIKTTALLALFKGKSS